MRFQVKAWKDNGEPYKNGTDNNQLIRNVSARDARHAVMATFPNAVFCGYVKHRAKYWVPTLNNGHVIAYKA